MINKTPPILEVKDLVCGYDEFQIEDINFKIEPGELTGIIGPNGSGKTHIIKSHITCA